MWKTPLFVGLIVVSFGPALGLTIVGGDKAQPGEFPFAVAIATNDGQVMCGASLIAPDWILTAAHCFTGMLPDQLIAIAGKTDLGSETPTFRPGEPTQVTYLTGAYSHPLYDEAVSYDMALGRLHPPFNLTETVATIRYADKGQIPSSGSAVTFVGWGDVGTGEHGRGDLMKLELPLLPATRCAGHYPGATVSPRDVCAGGVQGKDTCNGDSGGPAILRASDFGGTSDNGKNDGKNDGKNATKRASAGAGAGDWVLFGVQSRGTTAECANIDTLVLSTKVSELGPWVAETMRVHSAAPGRVRPAVGIAGLLSMLAVLLASLLAA